MDFNQFQDALDEKDEIIRKLQDLCDCLKARRNRWRDEATRPVFTILANGIIAGLFLWFGIVIGRG